MIGGSGFYEFMDDVAEVAIDTPYGAPSADIAVGSLAGTSVAFLPRHSKDHAYPPHLINYRANIWALRSLGVRQVLAPCAVGGLRDVAPGDLVVPDQLVDRTSARVQSYVDSGAAHVPFADPYCPSLSRVVADAEDVSLGGTMVVVDSGPTLSRKTGIRRNASPAEAAPPRTAPAAPPRRPRAIERPAMPPANPEATPSAPARNP